MALSTVTSQESGHCVTDIIVRDTLYSNVRFGVLKDLCSDVLLGGDFQTLHKRVVFEYDGPKSEFVINDQAKLCAVTTVRVKAVKLFENLAPRCQPIATKSRRFSAADRRFIKEEVDKLAWSGVNQPSRSP